MSDFSKRLRKYMAESHINAGDVSRYSGIDQSQVSRYLNGTRVPNVKTLYKIQAALGCEWSDLLGEPKRLERRPLWERLRSR